MRFVNDEPGAWVEGGVSLGRRSRCCVFCGLVCAGSDVEDGVWGWRVSGNDSWLDEEEVRRGGKGRWFRTLCGDEGDEDCAKLDDADGREEGDVVCVGCGGEEGTVTAERLVVDPVDAAGKVAEECRSEEIPTAG